MKFWKGACVGLCLALSMSVARADDPDSTAHNLAAQCAIKNGIFDAETMQCAEPSADSAAGDLVVGPMMKVVPQTHDGDSSSGQ